MEQPEVGDTIKAEILCGHGYCPGRTIDIFEVVALEGLAVVQARGRCHCGHVGVQDLFLGLDRILEINPTRVCAGPRTM